MKILAGSMITGESTVRLLKRGEQLTGFSDLNELRHRLAELPFVPEGDWSDFGRGSRSVRYLMLAAMLTAGDYGAPLDKKTGIIGWNGCGCAADNRRFWQDYVHCGRENGRGSLFVATLPTIPFCEAAIALGCHGPVAYFRTRNSTAALFRLLSERPNGCYLLGEVTENSVCMVLADSDGQIPEQPDFPSLGSWFRHEEKQG